MKKVKDLAVVTGTYTKDGQTKNKYKTVGAMVENDKGQFLFLDRSFNPAGVPFKEGSESIIISLFDPRPAAPTAHETAKANADQPQQPDEDIPF